MTVDVIEVPELGNRSYLVHDGKVGIVIDPSRRIQDVIDKAQASKIDIKAVFETHIHNDYVTGGLALAKKLSIPYYVSAHDEVRFEREKIKNDQVVSIGKLKVTALASPGHTSHHLSYLVSAPEEASALFSGGSLLYGTVGRTDLESKEATKRLAHSQYQTAQFFLERLDESTILYPTHGFGSFCAATGTEHVAVSTLKEQLKRNHAYTAADEDTFVNELLSNLEIHPSYYAFMQPLNLAGPSGLRLDPPKVLTKEILMRELHTGAAIIDMRSRIAYASKHVSGTYNIETNKDFATYVGWLLDWEAPIILVAPTAKEVSAAQEQLSLIGREVLKGQARPTELLASADQMNKYPVRSFKDLAQAMSEDNILALDVRRKSEWQKSHIPGALNIPLHELIRNLDKIADNRAVWVHCASGFRASIAASILSGRNKKVTLIDDNYSNAVKAGLLSIKEKKYVKDITDGKAQLLDVRNNQEWKTEHAIGAVHIPLGRLLDGDTGPLKEELPVYIYCETGDRSETAEYFLKEYGFTAVNINSLEAWQQAGGRVESQS